MREYYRDTVEDLDEYEEEEGEELKEEEEEEEEAEEKGYEEEEDRKPTKGELEYLELRQRLKESIRKQMKKENSSAHINSQEKKKLPYDNYGSFFGPSQPIIAQRVIQESKSLLETQHLASRVSNPHHSNKRSSASTTAGSRLGVHERPPKVANEVKRKALKLKDTRDYSFLLSDEAELPVPTKEPPLRHVSVPNSDARSAQVPQKSKQSLSNTGRQVLSSREERKPVSMNGQMQPKAGSHKINSAGKPNLASVASRKQLGSNNANGPGRPVAPKGLPSKMPVASTEKKASTPAARNSMPVVHKQLPSKLNSSISKQHSSISKQHMQQKKEFQEPSKAKVMPKQPMASSKHQTNKPIKKISSISSLQERPRKKPVRRYSDDEDDDAINMIRQMFRYNPNRYADDDDDDSDMEANFDDILREEKRSARIAREEDERELRLIEEEERREEQLRKEAKKRKLGQR